MKVFKMSEKKLTEIHISFLNPELQKGIEQYRLFSSVDDDFIQNAVPIIFKKKHHGKVIDINEQRFKVGQGWELEFYHEESVDLFVEKKIGEGYEVRKVIE